MYLVFTDLTACLLLPTSLLSLCFYQSVTFMTSLDLPFVTYLCNPHYVLTLEVNPYLPPPYFLVYVTLQQLITQLEECYWVFCKLGTSTVRRRLRAELGCRATGGGNYFNKQKILTSFSMCNVRAIDGIRCGC
jgi:hypothetical protein